MRHLNIAADGLELSAIRRRRELVPWLAFRFFHIRVLYNWAWDPDSFDWGPGTTQYRIRESGRLVSPLVGGYRLIAPRDSLSETMTYALPFFRDMVPDPSVWPLLAENHDLVMEVSRFALAFHRVGDRAFLRTVVRNVLRGILWEQAKLRRPLCLAVVNPFLLSRYRKLGLATKVIGFRKLRAASIFEKKLFGAEVPHYVVLINAALSEKWSLDGQLSSDLSPDFVFEGMHDYAQPFHRMGDDLNRRVQTLWDAVKEDPAASS
ncbi:MAG: hypothetical protein U0441_02395 [Polyangiaceae bacterium]